MTRAGESVDAGAAPAPLDGRLRELLERGRSMGGPPMYELAVHDARAKVTAGNVLCALGPNAVGVENITLGSTSLAARRYFPAAGEDPVAVVVYFHGGGWVTGDLDYADNVCRYLVAGAGVEVVSVDYRLAPEARFPAAADDAVTAVVSVAATTVGLPLAVAGDSAGGNLAAVAVAHLGGVIDIAAQVLLYPVLDSDTSRPSYRRSSSADGIGTKEMEWFLDHYCPNPEDRAGTMFSPMNGEDLGGLPPTVLLVAGHDPLHDEGVDFAERLRRAGVPVELIDHPQMNHGFFRFDSVLGDYVPRAAAQLSEALLRAFGFRN
ncbi:MULTISPECIES: alpha/beta hydrolase [Rhodococcus]|uniref:alpha/beta hydrolase n=1 Tax=Rhodococcus globerulus TaxID=33008 RepID=UPI001C55F32E|nr:alpha/beta hydrolase [Rhodococcus globerulus]QXV99916.1 alpha/beta hydrolase [Rhodococcus globerulus]